MLIDCGFVSFSFMLIVCSIFSGGKCNGFIVNEVSMVSSSVVVVSSSMLWFW